MDTKLTLKLNAEVIKQAKNYAASQQKSLSGIVEAYLKLLIDQAKEESDTEEIDISPFVKGMVTGVKIPSDINYKDAYANHMMDKYQ